MRALVPMTLAAVIGGIGATRATHADELVRIVLDQIDSAHQQNCGALERAPVRHWGQLNQLRPWTDLRHELVSSGRSAESRARSARTTGERFNTIYTNFVEQLQLVPAGDLVVGAENRISAVPQTVECTAFIDVPTALVLRVKPGGSTEPIVIASGEKAGLEIEGQTLTPAGSLTLYAVLPLTASGTSGRRELDLHVSVNGHQARIPLVIDVRQSGQLTGTIREAGSNECTSLVAKLFVEDATGRLYVSPGAPNYTTQNWYGTWLPRFTYVNSSFNLPLPPGEYRVTAMKGPGHADFVGDVTVRAGHSAELTLSMKSLWPLERRGWLCADMHTHARGIPLAMLQAEDVNLVTRTFYSSDKPYRTGIDRSNSDELHLSVENQEIEHWNFGNAFFFNIPNSVQDPGDKPVEMTPLFHYDQQAHDMGGITLRYMRSRPFNPRGGGQQQPELAVSAALGLMDVWTVMENSMQNLLGDPRKRWSGHGWPDDNIYAHTYRTWYGLANCGLRIPIAAGTSYGRLSRLGFNRVYAKVDGELTTASWAAALVRGDGFVTNGPLLWMQVDGRFPGDGLNVDTPGQVKVNVQLVSHQPVRLVEILQNGRVVGAREPPTGQPGQMLDWEQEFPVNEPCWFAARCFGEADAQYPHQTAPNQFAHTNILMVTVAGRRPADATTAARFISEIDALIEFAPNIPSDAMRKRALRLYDEARRYFVAQTQSIP